MPVKDCKEASGLERGLSAPSKEVAPRQKNRMKFLTAKTEILFCQPLLTMDTWLSEVRNSHSVKTIFDQFTETADF
ncbi:MAG: hypothetical protein P8Y04_05290, partial [Desulfobulbaceae bacterium]